MKQSEIGFTDNNFQSRISLALFIHSLSIISFQIILMRVLQINQWDHFANLIITIAMLGFGVSGTLLVLFKQRLIPHSSWLIPLFMLLSSFAMLLAYRFSQHDFLKFDTFLVFSSLKELMRLLLFILLYFLPFFAASFAIGLIYVNYVSAISRLYFSNLTGSGIGGVAALLLLHFLPVEQAIVLSTAFPAIAVLFIIPVNGRKLFFSIYAMLTLFIVWGLFKTVPPAMSQYKALSKTLQLPDAEVKITESGISSLVHIVESKYLRYAPALSLHYTSEVPAKPMAFINGNAAGFIPSADTDAKDMLDHSTFSLPYIVKKPEKVAVISSQTGSFVAQALRKGVKEIHAFESDMNLISALKKWHGKNGKSVYENEKVSLHQMEARTFLQQGTHSFDLIVLPVAGSFGGASGMMALREDYGMTIQSLEIYWKSLNENGQLSLTVYTDFPPRIVLKSVYSIVSMLKKQGIEEPKDHIAAIRSWTTISFLISKKPFDDGLIKNIRIFCADMGFDPFLLPDISEHERKYFNHLEDDELFVLTDAIVHNSSGKQDDYLFYIFPASDNKPFFSRFVRISKLNSLLEKYPWRDLAFLEPGYIIVWIAFIMALMLSVLFIVLPVMRFRKSSGKMPVLLYFGAIGLAFMFAEIILIQKFILFLGHPVFAVSAVLSIMLIASGMGSYFSAKIKAAAREHQFVFLAIFIVLFMYALFLTDFLRLNSSLIFPVKIAITLLIVGLPAFFMGMPFPLGLKTLSNVHKDKIAWAWGINGFFSVIAAPLALIIAVEAGSFAVILTAALVYLIALLALLLLLKTENK